jgi:hypothetical protein
MAGFDPDAYLAKKPSAAPPAFDPDAYLAAVAAPSSGIPTGPRATGTIVDQIPGYGGPVPAADNAPTLTTGQKIYRTVRPVVAPTIEALGTAGGAALGTFLGPAGTVGGAGLGYGMAKEALKLGDIYAGGMTPDQAQTQPVRNVLEGATFEAGGRGVAPIIGKGVGYVAGKVVDLRQIPNDQSHHRS